MLPCTKPILVSRPAAEKCRHFTEDVSLSMDFCGLPNVGSSRQKDSCQGRVNKSLHKRMPEKQKDAHEEDVNSHAPNSTKKLMFPRPAPSNACEPPEAVWEYAHPLL